MSAKPHTTTRRPAAKKAAKKGRFVARGYMGKTETVPLAIAAREALTFQIAQSLEDEGTDFKTWRHEQVKKVTGREGLTDCQHEHFRPLLAHFKMLAGKDDKAFELEMRTGKVTSSGAKDDTREEREKTVVTIRETLEEHIALFELAWPALLTRWEARSREAWKAAGEVAAWPGLDDRWLNKAMDRKMALDASGGPIREGYLVAVARQKTRRPDLNLGKDIWTGLAERFTAKQLRDLRSTLVNRIAAKEGVMDKGRNKAQKSKPAKEARSVKTLAPRHEPPAKPLQDLPPQPRCE